ncbi:hypothetical protein BH23PAT1_BH23PAT1_5410 [soil metagenome]
MFSKLLAHAKKSHRNDLKSSQDDWMWYEAHPTHNPAENERPVYSPEPYTQLR